VAAPDPPALRRLALAVSVLDDVDLVPRDEGILLTGQVLAAPVPVPWRALRRAVAGVDPESDLARLRVLAHLTGRLITATRSREELRERARPVGLPVDHPMHPGLDWVAQRVLGGALDLGLGFVDVAEDPDEVVVIPHGALAAAGVDPLPWWPAAQDYLERMGAVAAGRFVGTSTMRPIGDCDVVTLLASRAFRAALCGADPTGMRAAAVPMRRRGWLDLSRIDPAFTVAAAAATADAERGFARPLLLTVEEVAVAADGGRPAEIVLRDGAVGTPRLRPVLYH
jgi:hypothetical protein